MRQLRDEDNPGAYTLSISKGAAALGSLCSASLHNYCLYKLRENRLVTSSRRTFSTSIHKSTLLQGFVRDFMKLALTYLTKKKPYLQYEGAGLSSGITLATKQNRWQVTSGSIKLKDSRAIRRYLRYINMLCVKNEIPIILLPPHISNAGLGRNIRSERDHPERLETLSTLLMVRPVYLDMGTGPSAAIVLIHTKHILQFLRTISRHVITSGAI